MPKYKYKAKNLDNKVIKGIFYAQDEEDLRDIIANQNYYLISSKKIAESADLFTFLDKVRYEDLAILCDQLSVMLASGLEVVKAIDILKENTKIKKLQNILDDIDVTIQQGKMLSEAFAKYPKTFPTFFRNMVEIGEKSGKLEETFANLSEYYANAAASKRKIRSALSYPIFLICLAFGVIALLALYIIPMFNEIFIDMNAELPLISRIIVSISDFIKNNFPFIILGIILLGFLYLFLIKRPKFIRLMDAFKLKFFISKDVVIALATARFTRGFGLLISSGLPVVDSMTTMSNLLDNEIIKERLKIATNEVKRGKTIAKSIATIDTFPRMLVEMLTIGESTGSLEYVLKRVTSYYDEQVNIKIKKMTSMIEPILIMFVALIVVFVIFAVFLPILELQDSLSQLGSQV